METSGSSERSGTGERSISSVPGSPVSPIVTRDRGKGSLTPGISGPRHERSFGWWDPSGSCLRTYQGSLLEMTDGRATGSVYLESFPSWGLMLDGEFIAQPTPGRRTSGKGGGSWPMLPTPVATDSGHGHGGTWSTTTFNLHNVVLGKGKFPINWPTPTVSEAIHGHGYQHSKGKDYPTLTGAVGAAPARGGDLWPMPTSTERSGTNPNTGKGEGLSKTAKMFPTPRAGKTTDEAVKMHHIPTPTTADVYTGNMKSSQQSDGSMHSVTLPDYVEMFPTPSTMDHIERKGMRPSRAATNRTTGYLSEEVIRWNTPNTMDALEPKSQEALDHEHESARPGRSNPNNLRDQIAVSEGTRSWPTPTGDDANNVTRASGDFQSLSREAQLWPTPATSQDYKPVRPLAPSESGGTHGTMLVGAVGDVEPEAIGGSLNPDWVEQHLMSLPEGWTRLEPLRLGTNGRHLRNYGQYGFDFFEDKGAYQEWFDAMRDGTWWDTERGLPRVTTGAENRVNRLKMLGNGIVPATLALFLIDD